jgi:glc operon protein GlcG
VTIYHTKKSPSKETGMALKFARAQDLVAKAIASADKESVSVAVAVVDNGGRLICVARMDGVGYFNVDAAIRKARAAANFNAPTHVLAHMLQQDELMSRAMGAIDEFVLLPGAFPIVDRDELVGGIGVAGAHYAQDLAVIEAALR